jgi:hypothetical protein
MPTLEITKAYIVRGQTGPDYVQFVCTGGKGASQVKLETLVPRDSGEALLRELGVEECELQTYWDLERVRAENEKLRATGRARDKYRAPGVYPEIVKF